VNEDLSYAFSLYPNPASDYLHIDFREELESRAVLSIYNYAGNKVLSRKLPAGLSELRIDDLHLPEGIYIVRLLRDGRSVAYKKLIITQQ
ncbi:MAG: T9SS type A sorting domain-containing protein, partial [Bacteroidales bacterium]